MIPGEGQDGTRCRLCGGETRPLFTREILGSIPVRFDQCAVCGLTQTEKPTWLAKAYESAIDATDTGILARNLGVRRIVATFLHLSGVGDERCLDFAGGYGIFTRLMRDAGFDFRWMDPYAENLLARGFEWRESFGPPLAVTAFEVLEHFDRPLEEFRKIAALGAAWIVTSTEVHPGARPARDWGYLSVETGQHVAFYRADTLARLGREAGYPHVIPGPYVQIFARTPFPAWRWWAAVHFGSILFPFIRKARRSLTVLDCETLRSLRGGGGSHGAGHSE